MHYSVTFLILALPYLLTRAFTYTLNVEDAADDAEQ
jgi:hypothetical protein